MLKTMLKKESDVACREAMTVDQDQVLRELEITIRNLDAANTVVVVNSLAFKIMVGTLSENVSNGYTCSVTR